MRRITLTMLIPLILAASSYGADDLKSAFKEGELSGTFRTYYFTRDFDASNTWADFAAGGMLYYRTAPLYGVNVGLGFYTAQGMGLNNDKNEVYGLLAADVNGNHESFSVLGEAYIQYTGWDTDFIFGRQELTTPFVNKYDIRLVPQSTESFTVANNSLPGFEFVAAQVTKIKGRTSTDFVSMTEFAGITTADKPVTLGGATYSGIEGLKLQLWDFYAHDYLNDIYARVDYSRKISDTFSGFAAFQYLNQKDVGDQLGGALDANLYAIQGGVKTYGLTASLAYGEVGDQTVQYPWGHDFIISCQINDLKRADETGIMARLGYDFGKIGIKGLGAGLVYLDLDSPESGATASPDIDEIDFDVKYTFSDFLEDASLRVRYALIDQDEALGGEDFTDFRVYFDYPFSM